MAEKEKPIVIELYELWNGLKARFNLVSPQPKSFTLEKNVRPVLSLDLGVLEFVDLSRATSIPAAGDETVNLQAPAGFIYKVLAINVDAPVPVGGTAGTHYILCTMNNATYGIFYGKAAFGSVIQMGKYYSIYANDTESPAGDDAQSRVMLNLPLCSHTNYVTFEYHNDTDVAAAVDRAYKFWVLKYPEGVF